MSWTGMVLAAPSWLWGLASLLTRSRRRMEFFEEARKQAEADYGRNNKDIMVCTLCCSDSCSLRRENSATEACRPSYAGEGPCWSWRTSSRGLRPTR